jgi:hypothetical protein
MFKEIVKKIAEVWTWYDYNRIFVLIYDEYARESITWDEVGILSKLLENTTVHEY